MPDALTTLRGELGEIADLTTAARALEWDQLVMMPAGGSSTRADTLATLHELAHELFVRDEIGELLDELAPLEAELDPESDDACLIAVTRRDWEKASRVPTELTAELTKLASEGMDAWAKARAENDYASFRPWLDRTLELKHRYIACFPTTDDPYDVLLDDFERGMRTDEVRIVFDRLKPALRELVAAAPDDAPEPFLEGPYAREAQHELSVVVARAFGASEQHFRLDPTVHPFCMSLSTRDVRLTTRYAENDLHGNSLFSTMHEVGHGLYEHGGDSAARPDAARNRLLVRAARVPEPALGERDRPLAPVLALVLPAVPGRLRRTSSPTSRSSGSTGRSTARSPRFIRVDADETTYGLHIILRFELEQELLSGRLSTADLPEAWNTTLEELLGITPPNDRLGCLQDVHWSGGMFGYFPTYQLGNVLSVQIWERLLDRPARRVRAGRARLVRGDLRVAPRAPLPPRAQVHAGRDDRARRRRPDRPRAVPPVPRGQERHAARCLKPGPSSPLAVFRALRSSARSGSCVTAPDAP